MAGTNLFSQVSSTAYAALSDIDSNGLAVFARCTGTPPTTADTYQHGCLMIRVDSGTSTNGVYQNTGSSASPVWTIMDTSIPGDTASALVDTNGATVVDVATVASTVNNLRVTASATGSVSANAVSLNPVGTDAAVSLALAPKGATGILTLGLSTGTGDVVLGSSSAAQSVLIGNGAGVPTVNIANVSTNGSTTNISTAAITNSFDTINLATGNATGTGAKVVNILTGTPGTTGNNRLTMGGGSTARVTMNAVVRSYQETNYIASETGANDAIAGSLLNASNAAVTLAAGLRVVILLAHTLAAGAITFDLNGGGAVAIKSHLNVANNIATAYAVGSFVDLMYDGTQWQDMSQ